MTKFENGNKRKKEKGGMQEGIQESEFGKNVPDPFIFMTPLFLRKKCT